MSVLARSIATVVVVAAACGVEIDGGTRVTVRVAGGSALSDDGRAYFEQHDLALWLDMVELVPCDDDESLAVVSRARRFAHAIAEQVRLISPASAAHLEETPMRALVRTSLRVQDEDREWVALSPPALHICGVTVGTYGDEGPVLTLEGEASDREVAMAFEKTFAVDFALAESPHVDLAIRFAPEHTSFERAAATVPADDAALLRLASEALTMQARLVE
jgi:hypothetical protein